MLGREINTLRRVTGRRSIKLSLVLVVGREGEGMASSVSGEVSSTFASVDCKRTLQSELRTPSVRSQIQRIQREKMEEASDGSGCYVVTFLPLPLSILPSTRRNTNAR